MMSNQRMVYGDTLVQFGKENQKVVALEADLGKSTMSNFFGDAYPERYFQMGIAEANMVSTAAGLALTGHIPFVSTFAVFASGRPYDQIRSSVCIPNLNVKICGSSAGLSDFGDGKTHQSIDDIAIMRVLPHMTVLSPADGVETAKMMRMMLDVEGPMYLRLNRNDLPVVTDVNGACEFGKVQLLKDGKDAVIFATGVMVSKALEAAERLSATGIALRVVNVSTIKPLDQEGVWKYASDVKAALTAEEHSVIGGLGSAICEALSEARVPVRIMGIRDSFGRSATAYDELLVKYGLTVDDIISNVQELLK
ncbi:MAG: transketolase C-terminal domain-containing protein [Raoultibacter sp.]